MGLRFRIWMPAVAVFIVLLSIGTVLLYGLQAAAAATTIEKANPD